MAKILNFPNAQNAEVAQAPPEIRFNHLLPYFAVLQADVKQTLRSWIYRLWVFVSVAAALGYLMFRFGARQVAHIMTPAPEMIGDLLTWVAWGSVTLIIVLTSGAVCGERGTMADSVLSRGISRYQYFLGKWHARLFVILATFLFLSLVTLVGSFFLLHSDTLSLWGSLIAIGTVASLLVLIVTCGVAVSAVANTTVVAITVVWLTLYGAGFVLSFLPAQYPSPDRALQALPHVLRGDYNARMIGQLVSWTLGTSLAMAIIGMVTFNRKDV